MLVAALVLTGIAALIHVYIFHLESFAWTGRRAAAIFGLRDAAEAETTRALAFNQGFYNLFLAVAIALGTVLIAAGNLPVGATLVFVGAGSMVAAGLVLLASSPAKAGAALKQLVPPLLGVIALAIAIVN